MSTSALLLAQHYLRLRRAIRSCPLWSPSRRSHIAAAPTATASFDPPVVRPGEQSIYRVVFNALEESIEWPDKITAPPQLEIRPGAQGEILQMTGAPPTSRGPRSTSVSAPPAWARSPCPSLWSRFMANR